MSTQKQREFSSLAKDYVLARFEDQDDKAYEILFTLSTDYGHEAFETIQRLFPGEAQELIKIKVNTKSAIAFMQLIDKAIYTLFCDFMETEPELGAPKPTVKISSDDPNYIHPGTSEIN